MLKCIVIFQKSKKLNETPFPFGEFKSLTISRQISGDRADSKVCPCFFNELMSYNWPLGFITRCKSDFDSWLDVSYAEPLCVAWP